MSSNMITPEKAIEVIQKKIDSLSSVQDVNSFNIWQEGTTLTLINIYEENDVRVRKFEKIEAYRHYGVADIERVPEAKAEALEILKNLIQNLEDFGLPTAKTKTKSGGVNVSVHQNNDQRQTTNVNIHLKLIIDAIKDELKGSQVKELQTILESNEEPEVKRKSFVDKIKSFGSDVASNILANVLTNPEVYNQLGGML